MYFPQTSEYALRAMARIAMSRPGITVRAKDLAAETDIPVHYLSKILRKLVTAGILAASKGHGGGFVLSKPPAKIRFADILAAVDYGSESPCVFGWGRCSERHPCPLHDTWSRLKTSFEAWAKRTTLADVGPESPDGGFGKLKAARMKR